MTTTLITADNRIADMLYSLYDARLSFVHLNLIVYSTLVLDGGQYAPVWRNDRETRKLYLLSNSAHKYQRRRLHLFCLTILLFCKKTIFADRSLEEYHYKFIFSQPLEDG